MAASSTKSTTVETAEAETAGVAETPAAPPKRLFDWESEDGQKITLAIPKRIKRGKVARRLAQNDMFGALDLVFTPEEIEAIEELDLTPEEWDDFQERLFEAIAGIDPKS